MSLKFLTDENIAKSTIRELRNLGYDIKDVKEEKLYGISDETIIEIAIKEERTVITLDKDFGNVLFYPLH